MREQQKHPPEEKNFLSRWADDRSKHFESSDDDPSPQTTKSFEPIQIELSLRDDDAKMVTIENLRTKRRKDSMSLPSSEQFDVF